MNNAWWILGAALLLWGFFKEGAQETLWSIVAAVVILAISVAVLAFAMRPSGAIIIAGLLLAAGTWRLMWWLTDRGYI